jgi:hypothetical protein
MKIFAFFIIMFVSPALWSQERIQKLIHGKILADSATVEGIEVINLVNEKSTTTNKNGEFFILAKAGEVLVFSAVNLEFKRELIEIEDLKSEVVIINMIPKITELKEVIINKYPEINAVSLGIVSKGQKTYTPAERKLNAGGGLLNMISGRTAMLKKELKIEKKEFLLKQLDDMFETAFLVRKLKIKEDYVKGFCYYIVEDENFINVLKSKNKSMATFLMGELAIKYKKIIDCEKE